MKKSKLLWSIVLDMCEGKVTLINRSSFHKKRYYELHHSSHWVLIDPELVDGVWHLTNHSGELYTIKMTPEQIQARNEYIAAKVIQKIKTA
jgi:hypothetical protein